jgi:hypothetical protein
LSDLLPVTANYDFPSTMETVVHFVPEGKNLAPVPVSLHTVRS